jgi:hypothetical protein
MDRSVFPIALALLSGMISSTYAQDASVCVPLITSGLKEYSTSSYQDDELTQIYDHFCHSSSSSQNNSWNLGISAVVKAVPISLTGGSSDNKTAMDNFCKNYSEFRSKNTRQNNTYERINSKGYDTFIDCVRIAATKAQIYHTLNDASMAEVYFRPDINTKIIIDGVTTSPNVQCLSHSSLLKISRSMNTNVEDKPMSISCIRVKEKDNASYSEGNITISTNLGPYNFTMAAIPSDFTTKTLKADLQNEYDQKIDVYNKKLEALIPTEIMLIATASVGSGNTGVLNISCPLGWNPKTADLVQPDYAPFQRINISPINGGFSANAWNAAGTQRGNQLMVLNAKCTRLPLSQLK